LRRIIYTDTDDGVLPSGGDDKIKLAGKANQIPVK
jgi:hypothetical protein